MAGEKQKVKKALEEARDELTQQAQGFLLRLLQRVDGLIAPWRGSRDMAANNYELGLEQLRQGHVKDAIFRFKIVTWRQPSNADAWYYLGCAYLQNGENVQAAEALSSALKYQPGYEEAAYMLAIAKGGNLPAGQLPVRIPLSLAQQHFDSLAPDFTRAQLETYQYKGHTLLATAIRASVLPGRIDHVILELGVGSGLLGPLLRSIASNITGIDMSGPMLAEAMKVQDENGRKIYDALVQREVRELMPEVADEAFDIVAAAGLFSFIGDLQEMFAQCARVLKAGGLLAFTADKMEGEGFRFDTDAARFRFSASYLEDFAAANGLRALRFEEAAIYPGELAWLCVFSKE